MHLQVELLEVRLEPGGLAGTVNCPPGLRVEAGRYFLVNRLQGDILTAGLFASGMKEERLALAPPVPAGWQTGDRLVFLCWKLGDTEVAVAGGMESMSNLP